MVRDMNSTSLHAVAHDDGALRAPLIKLVDQVSTVVVGKRPQIETCVACLLAGGHLLIEDLPGVGKTTLAQSLALSLGLAFKRVQFTADMMPSDLIGVSIYERSTEKFTFHPGPVFSQVLLADEINRAGARTQSALLEAMEEQQVSLEGQTHPLPEPFFVIATQNPADQLGTHPLPESQLDRFLVRLSLGYPDPKAEYALLAGRNRRELLHELRPVMSPTTFLAARQAALQLHAAPALLNYVLALLNESRNGHWFQQGLSPRAGLALLRTARAHAYLQGRNYVSPEDVQAMAGPVLAHRLIPMVGSGQDAAQQLQTMIEAVGLV
ncbi:MoxR-like ATPase [Leptothrix ochracea L12]|uniref:MoxR-like ATPase n=2 Tax=Leptothrix ochracea TaxID=735331 RepID=I4Z616_9BURK|nr:MoxR-like ATPase [Leptothrix ochracea L12]